MICSDNAYPLDNITNEDSILFERNGYNICLAKSDKQRIKIGNFINNMYSKIGYCTDNTIDHLYKPNQISFEARREQSIIGTITIGCDQKDGLLADSIYREELNGIRSKGRKICEVTKLVTDNHQHNSKEFIASLFNLAYITARFIHKATDIVIEVVPRHLGYYKRLLGCQQIGEVKFCQRVGIAATLLLLDLDYLDMQVARLAGSHDPKHRSIYAYFLTKEQEVKVTSKLKHKLNEDLGVKICRSIE